MPNNKGIGYACVDGNHTWCKYSLDQGLCICKCHKTEIIK